MESTCELTHKKNSSVTMVNGHKLWRKVRLAAFVTLLLSTRRLERFFRNCLKPMVAVQCVLTTTMSLRMLQTGPGV